MNTKQNMTEEEFNLILNAVGKSFEQLLGSQKDAILSLLGKFPPEKIASMINQLPQKEKGTVDKIFEQYRMGQPDTLPAKDSDRIKEILHVLSSAHLSHDSIEDFSKALVVTLIELGDHEKFLQHLATPNGQLLRDKLQEARPQKSSDIKQQSHLVPSAPKS